MCYCGVVGGGGVVVVVVGTEGGGVAAVLFAGTIGTLPAFALSSSFFCILALSAKMITRITKPPQRIPTIHMMIVRTVPHPLDSVAVATGSGVVVSSDAHVVPSML